MENKVYYTLPDGTVIDDDYVADATQRFDDAMKNGTAILCPNPHLDTEFLHTEFDALPPELQKELRPFMLNA